MPRANSHLTHRLLALVPVLVLGAAACQSEPTTGRDAGDPRSSISPEERTDAQAVINNEFNIACPEKRTLVGLVHESTSGRTMDIDNTGVCLIQIVDWEKGKEQNSGTSKTILPGHTEADIPIAPGHVVAVWCGNDNPSKGHCKGGFQTKFPPPPPKK